VNTNQANEHEGKRANEEIVRKSKWCARNMKKEGMWELPKYIHVKMQHWK